VAAFGMAISLSFVFNSSYEFSVDLGQHTPAIADP
jgi:hypothetical protein